MSQLDIFRFCFAAATFKDLSMIILQHVSYMSFLVFSFFLSIIDPISCVSCIIKSLIVHLRRLPCHRRNRICSRSLIALVLLLQREKQHVMICSSLLAAAAASLCEVIKPRRLRAGAAAAAALLGTKVGRLARPCFCSSCCCFHVLDTRLGSHAGQQSVSRT
jgi:hypothetical protein